VIPTFGEFGSFDFSGLPVCQQKPNVLFVRLAFFSCWQRLGLCGGLFAKCFIEDINI
jgi:hypothetical protein